MYQATNLDIAFQEHIALLQRNDMIDLIQTNCGPIYRTSEIGAKVLRTLRATMNLVFEGDTDNES